MHTLSLGRTGLTVSQIGLGCNRIGGTPPQPDAQWHDLVRHARELGVTLFDTAPTYGSSHSERLLGEVLGGDEGVVIATKVRPKPDVGAADCYPVSYVIESAEASLRRLRRERLEILQLHSPGLEAIQRSDWPEAMARLQSAGKLRCAGVSVNNLESALRLIEQGVASVLQVQFSLLETAMEPVFEAARAAGVGLLVRMPLCRGILTGKFHPGQPVGREHRASLQGDRLERQLAQAEAFRTLDGRGGRSLAEIALRYPLSYPGAVCAIPGARAREQLEQNVAAGDGRGLDPETLAAARAIQAALAGG
jgi:aryl-alcohol dehydrogenase-like predicted oxidoreductase